MARSGADQRAGADGRCQTLTRRRSEQEHRQQYIHSRADKRKPEAGGQAVERTEAVRASTEGQESRDSRGDGGGGRRRERATRTHRRSRVDRHDREQRQGREKHETQ